MVLSASVPPHPSRQGLPPALATLCDRPDGTYLMEPMGLHMVQIYKQGTYLHLALLDQHTLQSDWVQTTVDLTDPWRLVSPSARALARMVDWGLPLGHLYLAGIGGGQLARVLHHRLPQTHLTAVDIDPAMVTLAQTYFGVVPDHRLQMVVGDGRQYLADRPQRYDGILINVALGNGYVPHRLGTEEFFALCRDRLTPEGTLALHLIATDPERAAKLHTLAHTFPHVATIDLATGSRIAFGRCQPFPAVAWGAVPGDCGNVSSVPGRGGAGERGGRGEAGSGNWDELVPYDPNQEGIDADLPWCRDDRPPADQGDRFPPWDPPFSRLDPTAPCPCGSGQPFGHCHAPSGPA